MPGEPQTISVELSIIGSVHGCAGAVYTTARGYFDPGLRRGATAGQSIRKLNF
jgi:hypothetical protein